VSDWWCSGGFFRWFVTIRVLSVVFVCFCSGVTGLVSLFLLAIGFVWAVSSSEDIWFLGVGVG
jgi:hypothetical protein